MFAYCCNDPVNYSDPAGNILISATIATTGAVAVAVVVGGIIIGYFAFKIVELFLDWLDQFWCFVSVEISYASNDTSDTPKEEPLPQQGLVTGNPDAPPVDAGKQGKHVKGHNNYVEGKSTWPEGQSGVQQTQEAWLNGKPDPKKPDGSVRIGIASDGTVVRVHLDASGAIHGYPCFKCFQYFIT